MPEMFPASGVEELVRTGGPCRRDVEVPAGFKPGDKVRAKNLHPKTHTRLPRYVRGKIGEVIEGRGAFVFPDTSALQQGEKPQHVYCVRFEAEELWGPDADRSCANYIELWEDYIEHVK
ncbi:nitrile hydratase subunit beta [Halomonas sp. MC140]|nr:SH3-like domain-containing protein [Halomonas sp. MC140]MDN7131246.1 nitrile hydratase subunit beta [Halomonas sp. MC140]